MSDTPEMLGGVPRVEPVRTRTLVLLRWAAIAGQLATVTTAWLFGVRFALWPVLLLIGAAAAQNIWLMAAPPTRMSPGRLMSQLLLDLIQLTALLALTGGLSNTFALLILAPVTVAATVLSARHTIGIGLATALMISIVPWIALPLRDAAGAELFLPQLLLLGHWLALLIGVAFFAAYNHRVTAELSATENALFATQVALAREQRLQHLGGVVAAAAHEMGTPLGTIKLIAGELKDELDDRADIAADLAALQSSADRCAEILRSMGQAGKDDLMLRFAPLKTVLEEAAQPHLDRGPAVIIDAGAQIIRRDPAIIHALRNLIQNAVDFARNEVHVESSYGQARLHVTIRDDGPGFPSAVLPRLGDPYPAGRRHGAARKTHEGMGLGLFIAKTLLERSGARVEFRNGGPGAVVRVIWPDDRILADSRQALGRNPRIIQ